MDSVKSANYGPIGNAADGTHGWGYNPRSDFNPLGAYQNEDKEYTPGSLGLGLGIPAATATYGAVKAGPGSNFLRGSAKKGIKTVANSLAREGIGYGQSAIRDAVGGSLGRMGFEAYQDKGLAKTQQATADAWRQNVGMFTDTFLPPVLAAPASAIADSAGYVKGGFDHYNVDAAEAATAIPKMAWEGVKGAGGWLSDRSGLTSYLDNSRRASNNAEAAEHVKAYEANRAKRLDGSAWGGIYGLKAGYNPRASAPKAPTPTAPTPSKPNTTPTNTSVNKP